ncbi:MAG: hypothetical protein JW828_16945 [Sedimentisphaerales bacterium]|nr:hypothetical protein [Sedimentisphaerales bacterium]
MCHKEMFFFGIVLILMFTPVVALAGAYSGGSGTAGDPYQVATAEDWLEIIDTSTDWDKYFVLTNDIDFEGITLTPIAPDMDPNKPNCQGIPFSGTFEGNGNILHNVVINQPDYAYIGLFGLLNGANIRNLGLDDIEVCGRYSVGSLVGLTLFSTRIESCYATGTVSGSTCIGGLVGVNGWSNITSCYATCDVSGEYKVGGLVGESSYASIISCYAKGIVNGNNVIGGLVGLFEGGRISTCYSGCLVVGRDDVGGFWSYNRKLWMDR